MTHTISKAVEDRGDYQIKGYSVQVDGTQVGFIEKDSDLGWVLWNEDFSDWFLGLETLSEVKLEVQRFIDNNFLKA